jgi:hypothetical protein
MDIFATSIPTVKRVPQQCRVPIAKAFTTVMRRCSVSGTPAQEMRAWQLHFSSLSVRQQPEIREGKKKNLKRNETLRDGLFDRLKRWNDGHVDVLWAEACKLYCSGERQMKAHSMASNIKRATECAQDARYGKAVAALLSLGTCAVTEDSIKEMLSQHPGALPPTLPSGTSPEPLRFDEDLVRKKVEGFQLVLRLELLGHGLSFSRTFCVAPTRP